LTLGNDVISCRLSRILLEIHQQIVEALADDAPVIVFGKDVGCLEMGKAVLLH
jgi:hypothetical protein